MNDGLKIMLWTLCVFFLVAIIALAIEDRFYPKTGCSAFYV